MAHGSASNFIRQTVGSSVATNDPETIDVSDASAFPDPSTSQYDIVIWDAGSFNRPDQDSNVEVLTVTARDTGNNTLTCARGQQGTSNTSHPNTSDVIVAPLSVGDFNTVRSQSVTTDGATIANAPTGDDDALRWQEGVEVGTVTGNGSDNSGGNDDWGQSANTAVSETFSNAFSGTPQVAVSKDRDNDNSNPANHIFDIRNRSSTGFDAGFITMAAVDQSGTTLAMGYVASEGR